MKMTANEKYKIIFGSISSLQESISWTTGVSNMLEWLVWSTNDVLGVTKTTYRKKIINWAHETVPNHIELDDMLKHVENKIKEERVQSERYERYDKGSSAIASPTEALRRAKYFSEDYLNKEFDIFWTLVSDKYLDDFYGRFIELKGASQWSTHGNSGLYETSTKINEMYMDNLSYNEGEKLLVANELKLGGKKNPDQILKYSLMLKLLKERNFVHPESHFVLHFLGDKKEQENWDESIAKEIEYCKKSKKSTCLKASQPEVIEIAKKASYASTTWQEMIKFNNEYMKKLSSKEQQVELKLLSGFNEALQAKKFMQ